MKNIKAFKILGKKVKVSHVKMVENYLGLYYIDENKIEINCDCPKEKLPSTIMHEFFHAVFKNAGLNQTSISPDLQEIIVEQFSQALCENFKLVKK